MANCAIKGQLAAKDRKAQTKEHIGELGDRGEGQQALHVLLRQVHKETKEHGDHGVDNGDPAHDLGNLAGRDECAREHAHADLNHRGAMQVGRNRRRRLHGRRQPHVHGNLCGLGPGRKQHEQKDDSLELGVEAGNRGDGEGAGVGKHDGGAQIQAERTDMRNDQGLHAGLLGRRRHVVANEAPRARTRDLKEHELTQKGRAVHKAGHGADEGREVRVEATTRRIGMLTVILAHIGNRIDHDKQADAHKGGREQRAHAIEGESHDEGLPKRDQGDLRVGHAGASEIRGEGDGADRRDGGTQNAEPLGVRTGEQGDEHRGHHRGRDSDQAEKGQTDCK